MSDYIDHFDYNIIRQVEPLKFIEDLRTDGRYFFVILVAAFLILKEKNLLFQNAQTITSLNILDICMMLILMLKK